MYRLDTWNDVRVMLERHSISCPRALHKRIEALRPGDRVLGWVADRQSLLVLMGRLKYGPIALGFTKAGGNSWLRGKLYAWRESLEHAGEREARWKGNMEAFSFRLDTEERRQELLLTMAEMAASPLAWSRTPDDLGKWDLPRSMELMASMQLLLAREYGSRVEVLRKQVYQKLREADKATVGIFRQPDGGLVVRMVDKDGPVRGSNIDWRLAAILERMAASTPPGIAELDDKTKSPAYGAACYLAPQGPFTKTPAWDAKLKHPPADLVMAKALDENVAGTAGGKYRFNGQQWDHCQVMEGDKWKAG